jgi:multicomponent Na+:H+ antiporter subunit E
MKHTISLGLLLCLLWWILSGFAKALLFTLGAVSVVFTLWMAHRMDVIDHESHPIHLSWRLVAYWGRLIREIVISNLQVLGVILSPQRDRIQPHFLSVRVQQPTALGKVILANSITLTPGTVSVDLDDDRLLVHALTRETGQAVREGQLDALVPRDVEEVKP